MSAARLEHCPVCGGKEFRIQPVLWRELIDEWELSDEEVDYINLQQGLLCSACQNNLRSMTLALALTRAFDFDGNLRDFCLTDSRIRKLTVVEINPAGNLTSFLRLVPGHVLRSFPEVNMDDLKLENDSVEVLIHSDTLEHVPDSLRALRECWRVLNPGGHLFYTVPIVKDRLTRKRRGLPASYHGAPGVFREDFKVETEYGANFWCEVLEAGFQKMTITTLLFPASVAIEAVK